MISERLQQLMDGENITTYDKFIYGVCLTTFESLWDRGGDNVWGDLSEEDEISIIGSMFGDMQAFLQENIIAVTYRTDDPNVVIG